MLENKQEEITQVQPKPKKNQRSCNSNINYTDVSDNDDPQNKIFNGLADVGTRGRLGKRTCSQRKRDQKKLQDQLLTDAQSVGDDVQAHLDKMSVKELREQMQKNKKKK